MYTRQLEWAKWAALDEHRKTEDALRCANRMGALTPPSDVDEQAVLDDAPSTPKTKRQRTTPALPVTPPRQASVSVAPMTGGHPPLEVPASGPPPGQPRKTPRTQRVMTQSDIEELDENDENIAAPLLTKEDDDEDARMEEEEAKDGLMALSSLQPPASPTKGARGRVIASKPIRSAPTTEKISRTTRASTRTATVASSAKTAATPGSAAALKARGVAASVKAKAATTSGAGAATTSVTTTSYKVRKRSGFPIMPLIGSCRSPGWLPTHLLPSHLHLACVPRPRLEFVAPLDLCLPPLALPNPSPRLGYPFHPHPSSPANAVRLGHPSSRTVVGPCTLIAKTRLPRLVCRQASGRRAEEAVQGALAPLFPLRRRRPAGWSTRTCRSSIPTHGCLARPLELWSMRTTRLLGPC